MGKKRKLCEIILNREAIFHDYINEPVMIDPLDPDLIREYVGCRALGLAEASIPGNYNKILKGVLNYD